MIDYDAFMEAMDGDVDMMSMIIELYNVEHGNDVELITELYNNQKIDELYQATHSLKGVLLTLCEDQVSIRLEAIEQLCKKGELPERAIIDNMLDEMLKVNEQISQLPLANYR
ncbi:hypothetical protein C9J01_00650 [Photobacterium rosenbergii]|uniref:HPt domain-containing protein n=1 Tax=Photobacterium rosenbergii TaxID=294936 RepID=A0A2T3NJD4_9GAMM|nr:Hpt domain-containing protein [Photobacterium rosenbergii]PSW15562.1 hypothetical protein C9J01_00650 [Photobacterium rosenbergii]